MKLRALMKQYPRTIGADETVGTAIQTMLWHGIRHLPVLEGDRLVGVVSHRDLAWFRAQTGHDANTRAVREAMHPEPQTASPDDSLTEAAARMAEARIGCLPITQQGKLLSLVTTTDVLEAEAKLSLGGGASTGLTAADLMTPNPTTVRPGDTLLVAAARMQLHNIRHLPVVDGANKVVGIISDRDLRTAVGTALQSPDRNAASMSLGEARVGQTMTREPYTVLADRPARDLASDFVADSIGAVPVVDQDDVLIGIVSIVDVVRGLSAPR